MTTKALGSHLITSADLHEFASKMQITGLRMESRRRVEAVSCLLYLKSRGTMALSVENPQEGAVGSPTHTV